MTPCTFVFQIQSSGEPSLSEHAAEKLIEAAKTLSKPPQAIQLRYLETLTEVAGEKSHMLVFSLLRDLLTPLIKQ
jgi:hypothetical protein